MEGLHIALAPEVLGHIGSFPVTNTLVTALFVSVLLMVVGFFSVRGLRLVPGKFQTLIETILGGVLDYMEEVLGDKKAALRFFPLIATLFIFILTANWLGLFPGVNSIGLWHEKDGHHALQSILYPIATDLNVTLALAVIVFLVIETAGVLMLGFLNYAGKFVNFKSPLAFFIGIIELFSEVARLVSFSFRLFGNIFAGKVLILIALAFVPVLLPVPLMLFEVLVGFIQAAIFALLTLFFIKLAITEAEH
jgi:F-type H+-transporting ATPase subunit a